MALGLVVGVAVKGVGVVAGDGGVVTKFLFFFLCRIRLKNFTIFFPLGGSGSLGVSGAGTQIR